jgi:SAM-dependent methyltransferase
MAHEPEAWRCRGCLASYPLVHGIVDFRLDPDPWISLQDDRAKAQRLIEQNPGADFEATVRAYWAMTPATPTALADRFIDAVLGAEQRTREWTALPEQADLGAPTCSPVLDLGCGTADLAAVLAARGIGTVSIDIAMRWLVQAPRRPALAQARHLLVCCNAEHLPFADASFGGAVSLGMLEHCRDARAVLAEVRRVLRPGAPLHLRTVNRFGLLPEPHVGVWGVGFVPRRHADAYVRWRSGQRYLHHRPISSHELRAALRATGWRNVRVVAASLLDADRARVPASLGHLIDAYCTLRTAPVLQRPMSWISPLIEASARRP